MLSITNQWQDPEILLLLFFCYESILQQKLGHMLKALVPKFRSDLTVRLKDIVKKQVPANLKPIAGTEQTGRHRTPRIYQLGMEPGGQ